MMIKSKVSGIRFRDLRFGAWNLSFFRLPSIFVRICPFTVHTIKNSMKRRMNSPKKQANDAVLDILQNLEPDPLKVRPVTFWFYSDFEENLYRAAHALQQEGYEIVCCEWSEVSKSYLLIGEKEISPSTKRIERLYYHFEELAVSLGVTFDGWETRIEMDDT